MRQVRRAALALVTAAVVFGTTGTASAALADGGTPLTIETGSTPTVDLSKDPVVLELNLTATAAVTGEVAATASAGVPLGAACDFIADGKAMPAPGGPAKKVKFAPRDSDSCDLSSTGTDTLSLRSGLINGNTSFEVTLKPAKPDFPIGKYTPAAMAGAIAALVWMALCAVVAWFRWAFRHLDKPWSGFWKVAMDSPTIKWAFSDSWLANFTAIGTAVAAVLALSDVLELVGPSKSERAAIVLLNGAALILTSLSPLAYLALRKFKITKSTGKAIPVQVLVVATLVGKKRRLSAQVPEVEYEAEAGRLKTPKISAQLNEAGGWDRSDRHIAVVKIETKLPSAYSEVEDKDCSVALDIPAWGDDQPEITYIYDVELPLLGTTRKRGTDDTTKAEQVTEDSSTYAPQGTVAGFLVATTIAAIGVAVQLAVIESLIARSKLTEDTANTGRGIVVLGVALAAIYTMTTIMHRVLEAETAKEEPKSDPEDLLDRKEVGKAAPQPDLPATDPTGSITHQTLLDLQTSPANHVSLVTAFAGASFPTRGTRVASVMTRRSRDGAAAPTSEPPRRQLTML